MEDDVDQVGEGKGSGRDKQKGKSNVHERLLTMGLIHMSYYVLQ
jgi:hypothetical protein